MLHTDATATVGYYPTDTVGQHTYLYVQPDQGEEIIFPCYGGARKDSSNHNVYPAHFWTPNIIGYKDVGISVRINLKVARAIATYQHKPDIRNSYDRRSGGWLNLGDCSGLVYGVSGVCHQMCNRILTASQSILSILNAPVNWPPSLSVTYWIYGFTGGVVAERPLAEYDLKAFVSEELSENPLLINLREDIKTKHLPDNRLPELQMKLTRTLGFEKASKYPIAVTSKFLNEEVQFYTNKMNLDHQLLEGTLSKYEYVEQLNKAFRDFTAKLSSFLPHEDYISIFGTNPEVPVYELVKEDLMPDDYSRIGKALKL
ncbi:hypothetical protein NIES4103_22670 [Nostoc sp. NIES-4103]|nr:hypothetical protein NIES4103_22670 [Nostoc sp. NIES-4103]